MKPERASCPGGDTVADTSEYSFDDGHLVLVSKKAGVSVVLERTQDGKTGTAVLLTGCWNMSGMFEPHPVQTL
jgi:hypothetical protein